MSIKSTNKHVIAFDKYAAEAATGSDKPYALMIKHAGLAACEDAIGKDDQTLFYKRLDAAIPKGSTKTILNNRRSEAWSCVKLAFEYTECNKAIFENIEKATPTPTGIYDIACSIRAKAHFAEGKPCYKKRIGLHEDSGKAPSIEAMQTAIKVSNAYRNDLSGASAARPLDMVVAQMVKQLESFRDGKRDPKTGKPARDKAGKVLTLPQLTSKALLDSIAKLNEFKAELAKPSNGKVVPLRRKAA
jgi:hypothetical protein